MAVLGSNNNHNPLTLMTRRGQACASSMCHLAIAHEGTTTSWGGGARLPGRGRIASVPCLGGDAFEEVAPPLAAAPCDFEPAPPAADAPDAAPDS